MVTQHKGLFTFHILTDERHLQDYMFRNSFDCQYLDDQTITKLHISVQIIAFSNRKHRKLAFEPEEILMRFLRVYQTLVLFAAAAYKCKQELSKHLEKGFLSKAYSIGHAKVVSDNKGIHRIGDMSMLLLQYGNTENLNFNFYGSEDS